MTPHPAAQHVHAVGGASGRAGERGVLLADEVERDAIGPAPEAPPRAGSGRAAGLLQRERGGEHDAGQPMVAEPPPAVREAVDHAVHEAAHAPASGPAQRGRQLVELPGHDPLALRSLLPDAIPEALTEPEPDAVATVGGAAQNAGKRWEMAPERARVDREDRRVAASLHARTR